MTRSEALNKILKVLKESEHNSLLDRSSILLFEIEKFMVPKPRTVIIGRKFSMDITNTVYAFEEPEENEDSNQTELF